MSGHRWSEEDDKAALKAYLSGLPQKEASKIAEQLGIPAGSFWMRIGNFEYLATNGKRGLFRASIQTKRVWKEYERTGKL